jgi:hypothetical protein
VLVSRTVQAPAHAHARHVRVAVQPDARVVVVRVAGAQPAHLRKPTEGIVRDIQRLVDIGDGREHRRQSAPHDSMMPPRHRHLGQ